MSHLKERKQKIIVPFIGGFSGGKSSLINALLNDAFLSTDITPETAFPVEITFGTDTSFASCQPNQPAQPLNISR